MPSQLNLNTQLLKQNPLILAEFNRAFGEVHHDLLNGLLHIMQNIFEVEAQQLDLFNYERVAERKVIISAPDLKELGKFGVNANQAIFDALKEISDTSATVRNFVDIDGRRVKAKTIRILDDVRLLDRSESPDGRLDLFEVQFNEWFLRVSTRQYNISAGNYTPIELTTVRSLNSKHAKKLYEIIKMQQKRNREFAIPLARAIEIFNLKEGSSFSRFTELVRRAAPKVQALIPFNYEAHKKDKLISFTITHPSAQK